MVKEIESDVLGFYRKTCMQNSQSFPFCFAAVGNFHINVFLHSVSIPDMSEIKQNLMLASFI